MTASWKITMEDRCRTGQLSLKKLGDAKSGKWANFRRRGVFARKLAHSICPWANFISKLSFHAVSKKYAILWKTLYPTGSEESLHD